MDIKSHTIKLPDLKNINQLYIMVRNIELGCRARRLLPLHHGAMKDFMCAIGRSIWMRNHVAQSRLTGYSPGEIHTSAILCAFPYNDSRPQVFSTQIVYEHQDNDLTVIRKPCTITHSHRKYAYDAFGWVKLSVSSVNHSPPTYTIWEYCHQEQLWHELQAHCDKQNVLYVINALHKIANHTPHLPVPKISDTYIHNDSVDIVWENNKTKLTVNVKPLPNGEQLSGYYRVFKNPDDNRHLNDIDDIAKYAAYFTRGPFRV